MMTNRKIKVFSTSNPNCILDLSNLNDKNKFIKNVPILFKDNLIGIVCPTPEQPEVVGDEWFSDVIFYDRFIEDNIYSFEFSSYMVSGEYDDETEIMIVNFLNEISVKIN